MPTIRLRIKGKVQGVFYRASAKEIADKIGVTGWIRNTADADVEAEVTGTTVQLQQFSNWCRQGPKRAVVTDLTITEEAETFYSGFSVKK